MFSGARTNKQKLVVRHVEEPMPLDYHARAVMRPQCITGRETVEASGKIFSAGSAQLKKSQFSILLSVMRKCVCV